MRNIDSRLKKLEGEAAKISLDIGSPKFDGERILRTCSGISEAEIEEYRNWKRERQGLKPTTE